MTLCFSNIQSHAQKIIKGIAIPDSYGYDFTSNINTEQYRLSIILPSGYSESDSTRYPVLYILGSNGSLLTKIIYSGINLFNEYPKIIIVGIDGQIEKFPQSLQFNLINYTPTSYNCFSPDNEQPSTNNLLLPSCPARIKRYIKFFILV